MNNVQTQDSIISYEHMSVNNDRYTIASGFSDIGFDFMQRPILKTRCDNTLNHYAKMLITIAKLHKREDIIESLQFAGYVYS